MGTCAKIKLRLVTMKKKTSAVQVVHFRIELGVRNNYSKGVMKNYDTTIGEIL